VWRNCRKPPKPNIYKYMYVNIDVLVSLEDASKQVH